MNRTMEKMFFACVRLSGLLVALLLTTTTATSQKQSYSDSVAAYRQKYIETHEVVGRNDRKYLHFYTVDKSYCVTAVFSKTDDRKGFDMSTSSGKKSRYFRYGILTFRVHDTLLNLHVYQSETLMKNKEFKDYLFVPFGDATSGFDSYGGGRYIDLTMPEIKNNRVILDFNKAYNPYCAYTTGYSCPLPPMENMLTVAIPAGEKSYGKNVH